MRSRVLLRYVGFINLGAVALTTLGLSILVVAATMIEGGGQLTRAGAELGTVLKLAMFGGIAFLYQILPAAVFLGALISGTLLARRGELLGAQTSGIGMAPIGLAFVLVALFTAATGYFIGEYIVPRAIQANELLRDQELEGQSDGVARFYRRELRWFQSGDTILYLPSSADPDATEFESPSIYTIRDGEVLRLIEAERLRFLGGEWSLVDARSFDVQTGEVTEHDELGLELSMGAQDIAGVTGDPRQMRLASMQTLIARRERAGFDVTSHRIEFHLRYVYPLNALWVVLPVLPWALHPDRRRSLAVHLGGGVVTLAVFFVLTYFYRLLALGHQIPVMLGAYGIPLTCIALLPASVALYRRYRLRGGLL